MFIDNVTTILLMTPIVIKLFECLDLNPVPVLPFIILNINIAGLTTLIGHPPNMLITENTYVAQHQVTFITYAMHMSIGVILALIQTNIHLRIQCRNIHKLVTSGQDEWNIWEKCLNDIESNNYAEKLNNLKAVIAKRIEAFENQKLHRNGLAGRRLFPTSIEQLKRMVCIVSLPHLVPNHPSLNFFSKAPFVKKFSIVL